MFVWLTEPFAHAFMRQALIASVLVGLTCALLGVHVVQRRMAFIGDAMAHTALPGLVLARLAGVSLFLGALAADLVTALGIAWVSRRSRVAEDTAIGVVFTGMFALGVLLASQLESLRDLSHMLFGHVLGVSGGDLVLIGLVCAGVLVTLALVHRELEVTAFDPQHAETLGLSAHRVRALLLVLLALTVVAGLQVLGVILTSALLITPAATASLLTRRLGPMFALAGGVAVLSAVGGLLISYHFSLPSGAAIVGLCTLVFLAVRVGGALSGRL